MNVFEWRTTPLELSEIPGIIYRDRTESRSPGMGVSENVLSVEIEIYGTSKAQIREILAQLERAVEMDPTWGGLALDSELYSNAMEVIQLANIFCASHIVMTVEYRTVRGDPYTQA